MRGRDGKSRRKKKGSLEETLSYAMYKDDPAIFVVTYRDMDKVKSAKLSDFMRGEDYSDIPLTRILAISREGNIIWRKGQKTVLVKS